MHDYDLQFFEPSREVDNQSEYLISHKSLIEQVIINAKTATYGITENYPKSAKGTIFYNEVISGLRDSFRSEGLY